MDRLSHQTVEVFEKRPHGFQACVEIASCFVEVGGKLLLLERGPMQEEVGAWGVPAGKMEENETPQQAAFRELMEETGIQVEASTEFLSLGSLFIRKPEIEYVFHLFRIELERIPLIRLSREHQAFRWMERESLLQVPLMLGAKEVLDYYQKSCARKKGAGAHVCVYLILKRGDHVLLQLRKNTGYCDGMYGLVSGHVEEGESATAAMMREAWEEAGIRLQPGDLRVAHVSHRRTNRVNVDIFFTCAAWEGDPLNREPGLCAELVFSPLSKLPANCISYIAKVFDSIAQEKIYSEGGWTV